MKQAVVTQEIGTAQYSIPSLVLMIEITIKMRKKIKISMEKYYNKKDSNVVSPGSHSVSVFWAELDVYPLFPF